MATHIPKLFGYPKVIIVLSGKRKSGKDYIANLLFERIGSEISVIIRLSAPIKEQYAAKHNLDYEKLLDASNYKETYRQKMIMWSEQKREKDPDYFIHIALSQLQTKTKEVWIISDARRHSDVKFFLHHYPKKTLVVRINASLEIRTARGWQFTKGVDDCESECGLDDFENWDFEISNNEDATVFDALNSLNDSVKILYDQKHDDNELENVQ